MGPLRRESVFELDVWLNGGVGNSSERLEQRSKDGRGALHGDGHTDLLPNTLFESLEYEVVWEGLEEEKSANGGGT